MLGLLARIGCDPEKLPAALFDPVSEWGRIMVDLDDVTELLEDAKSNGPRAAAEFRRQAYGLRSHALALETRIGAALRAIRGDRPALDDVPTIDELMGDA